MRNDEILFHSPFVKINNIDQALLYVKKKFLNKEIMQINLDNCIIQKMEKLNKNSTTEDLKDLGLYSLYRLLNESPNIFLCPFGILEMPGSKIDMAKKGYEFFCDKFWPSHKNDENQTGLIYDKSQLKIDFHNLSHDAQHAHGVCYLSYLLMQQILHRYKDQPGVKKFEYYIHGVIYYLDVISGFELEIAKYAFWDINEKELHNLPKEVISRRRNFKKNFTKSYNNFEKTKSACLNAAMDTLLLRAGYLLSAERNHEKLSNGYKISEYWLATSDKKLYQSANDIRSVPTPLGFGYLIEIHRENEIKNLEYWKKVDSISRNLLFDRKYQHKKYKEKIENISKYIEEIESDLKEYFHVEI